MGERPGLLVAAHGTEVAAGSATTNALVAAVRAARPGLPVSLCFLDVARPSLTEALDAACGPLVVLPLLLSTGYHVQSDIPAVVANRPGVRVARHLGPDRLVIDTLVDRLGPSDAATTALVGVGSSRPEARAELDEAARLLAGRIGRPVTALTLGQDVRAALQAMAPPVDVATYLLAEGRFVNRLRQAAAGIARVADPIGVHPALVELALARYDEAGLDEAGLDEAGLDEAGFDEATAGREVARSRSGRLCRVRPPTARGGRTAR
jgi:sirohydrochlorin ferrochelatase